jgi:tetratricopeptide (TPR) repeat protein
MAESPAELVARLLAEGLEHFGQDRVEQAISCWRMVLELEPSQCEARDYLESAGVSLVAAGDGRARLAAALARADAGATEEALALLIEATAGAPDDLEAQAALDLVRAQLYLRHRQRMAAAARPRLCVAPDQLMSLDLAPEAGFLLSLLDGRTRIEELVTVSGLDPFDVLHLLARLEQAGVVEIAA